MDDIDSKSIIPAKCHVGKETMTVARHLCAWWTQWGRRGAAKGCELTANDASLAELGQRHVKQIYYRLQRPQTSFM